MPVYETSYFTKQERISVVEMGLSLYKRGILVFRLGKVVGTVIYWISKWKWIDRVGTHLALNNRVGRKVYGWLSRKSVEQRRTDD